MESFESLETMEPVTVAQPKPARHFGREASGRTYYDSVHVPQRETHHQALAAKHAALNAADLAEQQEFCDDVARYGKLSRMIQMVEGGIDVNCFHGKTFPARAFKYCGKTQCLRPEDKDARRFGEYETEQNLTPHALDKLLLTMLKIYLVAGGDLEALHYEEYIAPSYSYPAHQYLKDIYEGREPMPTRDSLTAEGITVDWAKRDRSLSYRHYAAQMDAFDAQGKVLNHDALDHADMYPDRQTPMTHVTEPQSPSRIVPGALKSL